MKANFIIFLSAVILLLASWSALWRPPKYRCIFLHGLGQPSGKGFRPTFPEYWGNVHEHVYDLCNEVSFYHTDTMSRGWNESGIQKEYCHAASGVIGKTAIRNTIIFTHSMANLILAGAIKNGHCSFGKNTHWFSSQGPILGSNFIPDVMEKLCILNIPGVSGACTNRTLNRAAISMIPPQYPNGNHELLELPPILKRYTSGVVCSTLKYVKEVAISTILIGKLNPYLFLNPLYIANLPFNVGLGLLGVGFSDGAVPLESCMAAVPDAEKMSTSYECPFYLAKINHFDGTCRNGDGYGDDNRPCSWYRKMVEMVLRK